MENSRIWMERSRLVDKNSQRGSSFSPAKTPQLVHWHPPPPRFIKLNFDGCLVNSTAAGGYILRDWTGKIIKVGAANYGKTSIIAAEARALCDGIKAAAEAGFHKLYIEGDNLTVIQAVQGKIGVPWKISTILEDVRTWILQMTHVQIHYIFQEANMAVDWLSKFGHTVTDCFSSDNCFSSVLGAILTADVVGYSCEKRRLTYEVSLYHCLKKKSVDME